MLLIRMQDVLSRYFLNWCLTVHPFCIWLAEYINDVSRSTKRAPAGAEDRRFRGILHNSFPCQSWIHMKATSLRALKSLALSRLGRPRRRRGWVETTDGYQYRTLEKTFGKRKRDAFIGARLQCLLPLPRVPRSQ